MSPKISRRELLAWLGAGGGAAAAGLLTLDQARQADRTGSTSSASSRVGTPGRGASTASASVARASDDRLLVVLEMPGGNDGHSMIVPHGVTGFYDLRPRTGISQDDVLMIDDRVGYAPTLGALAGRGSTIVHGVGSPVPNGSHFEMMNRWWAGNPRAADTTTGWIGRLADALDDGAAPVTAMSVAAGGHPIIRSARGTTIAIPGVDALWTVSGAGTDDDYLGAYQTALRSMSSGGSDIDAVGRARTTMTETIDFADRLLDGSRRTDDDVDDEDGAGESSGYGDEQLGRALRFAATTFERDLGVRVIHVSMTGDFDTHEGHAESHAYLMQELDRSLAAFHADLERRGLADRVVVMTVSEFGRTAGENGSIGLDHGTSSTMLLEGPGLRSNRQLGEIPSLTRFDDNGDFLTTVPFDSYLAGVVEHWMGVPSSEVFTGSPEPVDIFA